MIIELQTVDTNSGYELCIYPRETRRKRADWIMWISKDGSGELYIHRETTGALQGKPIKLPALIDRKLPPVKFKPIS